VLSVAVGSTSRGSDTITCRDIRYKGEDTSAYRFIERNSTSQDEAASDVGSGATMAAVSLLPSATETTVVGETSADEQPRPITEQQAPSAEPIKTQSPQVSSLITSPHKAPVSSVTSPQADFQSQPMVNMQQAGPAHPITAQQSNVSQPITSKQQEPLASGFVISQPVSSSVSQSQSNVLQQATVYETLATQQPILSHPVDSEQLQLIEGLTQFQPHESVAAVSWPDFSQPPPVTAQRPALSEPVIMQPAEQVPESRPITTHQSELSQPITVPQPEWPRLFATPQCPSSQPITALPPELSCPLSTQQPAISPQIPPTNFTVSSLSPLTTAFLPNASKSDTAVSHLQLPSIQCLASNQPLSAPPGSYLTVSPVLSSTSSPVSYTKTSPISQASYIPDYMLQPPPTMIPARRPIWSVVAPQQMPAEPRSSVQYSPRPVVVASSSPTPGILCRPSSQSVQRHSLTPDYDQTLGRGQIQDAMRHFRDGLGDGAVPFMNSRGQQFGGEFHSAGYMSVSLPPTTSPSSGTHSYGQREFGDVENLAGSLYGNRGVGAFDQAAHSHQANFPYLPVSALNVSANMWPSAQPMTEFPPSAEFPTGELVPLWSSTHGYIYVSPNEAAAVMCSVASGDPPWNSQDMTTEYWLPESPSVEIPNSIIASSQHPVSAMQADNAARQRSELSGDQPAVSTSISFNIDSQSYADAVRSAMKYPQVDGGHTPQSTAERSDDAPESYELVETDKYDTHAGSFTRGNCPLFNLIWIE